ncbi:MAG: YbgC/FadM family acyl-CoA thioesterase [Pseudomonadota bacterium]
MYIFKAKVYYEDTDAIGVVYHANYLKFCDRARTQWLADLGIFDDLASSSSTFVVAAATMRFIAPARLGDELRVNTSVEQFGRASVTFFQTVERDSDQRRLFEASIRCAHVAGSTLKPARMPLHYTSRFTD